MLVPTIYFLVVLHIVALIRVLVNKGTGIELGGNGLHRRCGAGAGQGGRDRRCASLHQSLPGEAADVERVLKLVLYWLVALVIHYLERLYDFWEVRPTALRRPTRNCSREMVWPHFWAIQILLSVLILIYCVINELARVVGRRELRAMFFGPWPGGARTLCYSDRRCRRRHVPRRHLGAPAEKVLLHLLGKPFARPRIGKRQPVLVHQHRLVLEPLLPRLFRKRSRRSACRARPGKAESRVLRPRGRASRTEPFVP